MLAAHVYNLDAPIIGLVLYLLLCLLWSLYLVDQSSELSIFLFGLALLAAGLFAIRIYGYFIAIKEVSHSIV